MEVPSASSSDSRALAAQNPNAADARPPIDREELRLVLSSLSHELCRPLVSLRAGFDLLVEEPSSNFTPDQRGNLQTMIALCDDLLRLARGYLDYAGILQGVRPLRLGSFTIGALIQEIDRQFAPVAAARRVDWKCRVDGPDDAVITDAARCQQILGSLASNALKYTPEGGNVSITGRFCPQFWKITVADSGPGIPAEAVDRVFDPFFRLPREDGTTIEGNGLGLAICRELTEQLQGEIALTSIEGKGTSVSVRFPRH